MANDWTYMSDVDLTNGGADDLTVVELLSGITATEIEIMVKAVSTNTDNQAPFLQLSDESGYYTTGYDGSAITGSSNDGNRTNGASTFRQADIDAVDLVTGMWRLVRYKEDEHLWYIEWRGMQEAATAQGFGFSWITLNTELTGVRVTTTLGTATFDGGTAKVRYRGTPDAYQYEDLDTYTEVDSDSDITIHKNRLLWDTMSEDAVSYVYKDFGVDYFGDFVIQFELDIDYSEAGSNQTILQLSNTIGTRDDTETANDGLLVFVNGDATGLDFSVKCENTDNQDDWGRTSHTLTDVRYCELSRSGTTLSFTAYSDKFRTVKASASLPISVTCESDEGC
jgi:hypothetical protein